MWKKIFVLCTLLLIFMAGCTNNNATKQSTDKTETVTKTIGNKNMKINKVVTTKSGKDKDKNIVEVEMMIVNKGTIEDGAAAYEFYLKVGDKNYTPYPDGNNLNAAIAPGKEIKGSLFFEVPASKKEAKLMYMNSGDKDGEWTITIPKAT